ncbi:iron-sulfur cluster biosynthesis family protein [Guptibacillus hwajinpoensis]|uniref:iron-sulfur cluster biosynthesis family protein n=1 Tax=Guptibacillus hwajinpoensis TaxID=208199 RepID=UPI00373629FB
MTITFTNAAIDQLNTEDHVAFQLNPSLGGCSIGADWITFKALSAKEAQAGEKLVETNYKPVVLGAKHEAFFKEDMIIDYSSKKNAFMLKSKSEILSPHLPLEK